MAAQSLSFLSLQSVGTISSHMTLPASLLRELVNPDLSVGGRAQLCCELARAFEDRGEYEEARQVLSIFWQRIGERPKLEGLDRNTAAEVLMRAGVLTGLIGSHNQVTGAQETAKDLISESLTIFESLSRQKKIAEAQAELALCYWRTGEFNEARDPDKDLLDWLKFAQSETDGSKTRAFDSEEFDRELNNLMKQQATRIVEALLIEYPELDLNRAEAIVSESLGVKVEHELVS